MVNREECIGGLEISYVVVNMKVDDFNTALLAKQLWRLISVYGSLFAKVLKGRYYRNSTPLDQIKSYSSSYS